MGNASQPNFEWKWAWNWQEWSKHGSHAISRWVMTKEYFFYPERDTFHFDILSLFVLEHFSRAAILNPSLILTGFCRIWTFSKPIRRMPHVLGMSEIVLVLAIQPVFYAVPFSSGIKNRDNSIPGVHQIWELKRDLARSLKTIDLSGVRPSERRWVLIKHERRSLFNLVRFFFF